MKLQDVNYKARVMEDDISQTNCTPAADVKTDYIELTTTGQLTIKKGYACDLCSGPTWDDKTNKSAGVRHDAKCQLIRLKLLDKNYYERTCIEFKADLKKAGMNAFRRAYYFFFVSSKLAEKIAEHPEPPVYEVP